MKVELNKIFEVKKGNIVKRWKVIEHPYFEGSLTLVRDYCGVYGAMKNGVSSEDFNHVGGMVTLENAYNEAFLLS